MENEEKNEQIKNTSSENEKSDKETAEKKDCIIDPKQQELDELNDRYKRVLAEFENFKKRSGKERETLYNSILSDKHIATGTIADIKADELGKVTRIATVSNLDTSKKYYVIFIAPAYFAGYIGKV